MSYGVMLDWACFATHAVALRRCMKGLQQHQQVQHTMDMLPKTARSCLSRDLGHGQLHVCPKNALADT